MAMILGTDANNNLTGTTSGDTIVGAGGNDKVNAGAGNDLVDGGAGNDKIDGGLGDDTLLGGSGNDNIDDNSGANLIYGGSGNDDIKLKAGLGSIIYGDGYNGFTLTGPVPELTSLSTTLGNDKIDGSSGADVIYGDNGNNLSGNGIGGDDDIDGGAGNDLVYGEGGKDDIRGGDGDDTLIGGAGADKLAGGNGNDRFVYQNTFESTTSALDKISDFTIGQDKFDLTAMLAGGLVWSGATAALNSVWVTQSGGNTFVRANVNGDTDFVVQLNGLRNLAASDFLGLASTANQPPALTGAPAVLAAGAEDITYTILASALLQGYTDINGDTLAVSGLTASNGTLASVAGGWTFTPAANYNGAVNLSYNVVDGNGGSVAATRTFSLAAVNDVVTGSATAALSNGNEDTTYLVTGAQLLQGFSDVDIVTNGQLLSVSGAVTATHGTVSYDAGADTYSITPEANYNGAITLNYGVTDSNGSTVVASQSFTLNAVNDGPAGAATALLDPGTEDVQYVVATSALLAGFTDPDGDALLVAGLSAGTNGIVVNNGDGSWTITPTVNFGGPLSLSYDVVDGNGGSVAANQSVSLVAVADAPSLVLVNPAHKVGDGSIALSIVSALGDTDGSESLSILIAGVPTGWLLSAGVLNEEYGTYALIATDLPGLMITPPPGTSGSINLSVTVTAKEASNGDSVSQTAGLAVSVSQPGALQGQAIDGYIAGATVFADADADGFVDANEARATTDASGNFTLIGGVGSLVMFGGTDVSTGLAFEGFLRAPAGSKVVTPLTTLVEALAGPVADQTAIDAAADQVASAFGIDPGLNLLAFDPVASIRDGDGNAAAAEQVLAAGIQVQNAIVQIGALLEGAGATDASEAVITELALLVAGANGLAVNLADAFVIGTLINDSADTAAGIEAADVNIAVTAAASVLAAANTEIADAVAGAGGTALLEDLAQVAVVAQGNDVTGDLAFAGGNNETGDLAADYTAGALDGLVADAADDIGDVDGGLNGTVGNDTLTGGIGNDAIAGIAGNDSLSGDGGNDTLLGGAGNDTLRGGAGNDVLNGGFIVQYLTPADWSDTDRADYSDATQQVVVNLATGIAAGAEIGTDQLIGIEEVAGGSGNDSLTGSGNFFESFIGGASDDTINGAGGNDRAIYTDATGAITVSLGSGNPNLPSAAGSAVGNASVGADTLVDVEQFRGSAYNDTFVASGFVSASSTAGLPNTFNSFEGLAGNDTITGNGNTRADYLNATGAVTVNLHVATPLLGGSSGSASGGGVGTDTLLGGIALVRGSAYADTMTGGSATSSQVFEGRGGNDSIDGGSGFDTAVYGFDGPAAIGLSINMAAGTVAGDATYTGTDTLRNVEGVQGSIQVDVYNAVGFGLAGALNISSSSGNFNQFEGMAGDDLVIGNGNTLIVYSSAREAVNVNLMTGIVFGGASVGTDTVSGVTNVRGSNFNDTIIGTNNSTIFNEVYAGRGGDDTINGNGGTDQVTYDLDLTSQGIAIFVKAGTTDTWTVLGGPEIGNDELIGIYFIRGTALGDSYNATGYNLPLIPDLLNFNVFEGGNGDDSVVGNGATRISYQNLTEGVVVTLTGPTAGGGAAGTTDKGHLVGTAYSLGRDTFSGVGSVRGSNFADSFTGSAANEIFDGRGGNDIIMGGGGFDQARFESSSLAGGSFIAAANGAITAITGSVGADWGLGTDTLTDIERVRGTTFDDVFDGALAPVAMQYEGFGGNDTLRGGGFNDSLDGGSGTVDLLDLSNATASITLTLNAGLVDGFGYFNTGGLAGLGTDSYRNFEGMIGSAFNDNLTGDGTANALFGGDGNDNLFGGAGNDSLFGGLGNEFFVGEAGNDTYDGGAVIEQVIGLDFNNIGYGASPSAVNVNFQTGTAQDGWGGADILLNIDGVDGSSYADTLIGSTGRRFEIFTGREGNDTIDGGAISDTLNETDSNRLNVRAGGSGSWVIDLAAGTANSTTWGNDTIRHINQVRGSDSNDTIYGSDRTDVGEVLEGRAGIDLLDGRGGFDTVRYDFIGGSVHASLMQGKAYVGATPGTVWNEAAFLAAPDHDFLFNLEGLRGSFFDDTLIGGNSANDALEVFRGQGGNDYIDGGSGFDRIDNTGASQGVVVTLGGTGIGSATDGYRVLSGSQVLSGGVIGSDTLLNIEAVRGSTFADNLTGSDTGPFEWFEGRDGNDTIDGNAGVDRASYFLATSGVAATLGQLGADGSAADGYGTTDILRDIEDLEGSRDFNDSLTGNELNNSLAGLGGNDSLAGGTGNDTLAGGKGDDSLVGGSGADSFVWNLGDGVVGAPATDTVADFVAGDVIDLRGLLVGESHVDTAPGNLADYLHFVYSGGNTTISVDSNGLANGTGVDQIITLVGYDSGGTGSAGILQNLLDSRALLADINDFEGTNGDDSLVGNAGNNVIVGLAGNDQLFGLAGNDTLRGGAGNDVLNGGVISQLASAGDFNDSDRADFSDASQPVFASLANGIATGADIGSDQLIGIEELAGGSGNDSLTGSDTTFSEIYVGGAGNDTIDGAGLVDTAIYAAATGAISANIGSGNASAPSAAAVVTGDVSVGTDNLLDVEFFRGSAYNDSFVALGFVSDSGLGGVLSTFTSFEGMGGDDTIVGNGNTRADYTSAPGPVTASLVSASATIGGSSGTATGAGVGTDTLSGINFLRGSAYADTLTGGSAGSGQTFDGRGGNDFIDGGNGFDFARYSFDGAISIGLTIDMAAGRVVGDPLYTGTDTLRSVEAIQGSVLGDVYDARSYGLAGALNVSSSHGNYNDFEGLAGNDLIYGNGNTAIRFLQAREGVTVNLALGTVAGGPSVGNDTIMTPVGSVLEVRGSNFNDTLVGSNNQNNAAPDPFTTTEAFFGRAGNDVIDGGGGWDEVRYHEDFAASGITVVRHAGNANTLVVAGDPVALGTDTLIGISYIRGTNFADSYNATGYNPGAIASYGDYNEFEGGGGNDTITGNTNTRAVYSNAGSSVSVNLEAGTAFGTTTGNDTLIGINQVRGSGFADTLTGSSGNDTLKGGQGNDTLTGGAGNDRLDGQAGNDTLAGGAGDDTYQYGSVTYAGDGTTVIATRGFDTIDNSGGGFDTLLFDNLRLGYLYGSRSGDDFVLRIQPTTNWNEATAVSNLGTVTITNHFAADGSGAVDRIQRADGYVTLTFSNGIHRVQVFDLQNTLLENFISGFGANDLLVGLAGNDEISGGDGNDTLRGGAGNDTIDGGDGSKDLIDFSDATGGINFTFNQGTNGGGYWSGGAPGLGNDWFKNIEGVIGSAFNDNLNGSSGNDALYGGDGNDNLFGGAGDDSLYGGLGSEFFSGEAGNDTYDGGPNVENFIGTDFNNINYRFSPSAVYVNLQTGVAQDGYGGTDTLINIFGVDGSSGDDVLIGTNGGIYFELFNGREGNDTIDGGIIADTLAGTNGNRADYRQAGSAVTIDLALGTASSTTWGNDILININEVRGTDFADFIYGSDRTDIFEVLEGRAGIDILDGRGGLDILRYDYAGSSVTINLAEGKAYRGTTAGTSWNEAAFLTALDRDFLFNIEYVRGSFYDDTLIGGNAANDALEVLRGQGGNDYIDGGSGYDRVDYISSTEGVTVTLGGSGAGTATDGFRAVNGAQVYSGGTTGVDTLWNIEAVRGSRNADVLNGSDIATLESFEGLSGADIIDGNGGLDRASYFTAIGSVTASLGVSGADGSATDGFGFTDILRDIEDLEGSRDFNDSLTGNELNNKLAGLGGMDSLAGGTGNDTLSGGKGNDLLVGGGGDDTFVWNLGDGGVVGTPAADTVADFLIGDVIDLRGLLVGESHIGTAAGNLADYLQFVYSGGNTTISVDSDGLANGAGVDQTVTLVGYNSGGMGSAGILQNLLDSGSLLADINDFNGTNGDDILTGNAASNLIAGLAGIDQLFGLAGNDTLRGGAGNDVLNGGVIVQLATAGDFNDSDRADFSDATQPVFASLASGTATGVDIGTDQLIGIEELAGGSGNDSLTGSDTTFGESFVGGAGNDTIDGGGLNDTAIYAEATGAISVSLGSGNTSAPSGAGVVNGDASVGADTLLDVEQVRGSAYNDSFVALGFVSDSGLGGVLGTFNTFEGMGGNDTITGNGATRADYMNAPASVIANLTSATPTVGGSSGTADGVGVGTDTLSGVSFLRGSAFADTLTGGSAGSSQTFDGRGGNDFIDGGNGFDFARYAFDGAISTGIMIDMAAGRVVGDPVYTGTDTLRNVEAIQGSVLGDVYDARSYGLAGALNVSSSSGNFNDLEGLAGDDLIYGNGNTGIRFTLARESVTVNLALGTVVGGPSVGIDTIMTPVGSVLEVRGSNFNDVLIGSNNQNSAAPDPFTTTEAFFGRAGNDVIDGGGGWDAVRYHEDFVASGINVVRHATNINTLVVTGDPLALGTDTLIGISYVRGTNFADTYNATGYNPGAMASYGDYNEFEGGGGDDIITGNSNTRAVYSNAGSGVTVNLEAGSATGTSTGNDTLIGIHSVRGSGLGDTLIGSSGNDTLKGGNGSDLLTGALGNDSLDGQIGDDTLSGSGGDDRIAGGKGNDALEGGTEADTFVWNLGDGGVVGTPATDVVSDFLADDLIDLSRLLVDELHSGTDPGNLADYLQFSYSDGNTTIGVDSDGLANGAGVDQTITLVGYNTGFSDSASILQYMLTNGDLFAN